MDAVLRALAVYAILLTLFRITGKRTIAHITTFDFALLLVVAEATQQALLGEDFSIMMMALVVITLVGTDRLADYLGFRFKRLERLTESAPIVLVDNGKLLRQRLAKEHLDEEDVLQSARQLHGLERMDQIKYAVLEKSGGITIVPQDPQGAAPREGGPGSTRNAF